MYIIDRALNKVTRTTKIFSEMFTIVVKYHDILIYRPALAMTRSASSGKVTFEQLLMQKSRSLSKWLIVENISADFVWSFNVERRQFKPEP